MNIAYSFDENYTKYGGISLFSLLKNNQEIEIIVIYIIGDNLSPNNIDILKKIAINFKREIHFIDLKNIFPNMRVNLSFGRSAYGRLFLANHLNVNKIFYFDSDTVITGSLKELLEIPMDQYLLAGVQDTVNPYYTNSIGLKKSDRYVNSGGVIIINISRWKEFEIEQKCVDFIKQFKGKLPHADQTAINNICKGYIHFLHPKYNLMNPMFMFSSDRLQDLFRMEQYYTQEQLDEAINNPVVIHYTSEFFNRPWFKNCTHPLKEIFLNYMNRSPWEIELKDRRLSKNCRIQNFVYHNFPFSVYKMMIRYIELKHKLSDNIKTTMYGKNR